MLNENQWEFLDIVRVSPRICPKCESEKVMFSFHNPSIVGVEFSALCKECGYEESILKPDFVRNWIVN